jgi:hypothetical protein
MSSISLNDFIIAVLTTVGIAVAVSIALVFAGALFERSARRSHRGVRVAAAPAQQPTQTDDLRELVLR